MDGLDWMDGSPGGVKYKAPYSANNSGSKELARESYNWCLPVMRDKISNLGVTPPPPPPPNSQYLCMGFLKPSFTYCTKQ